MQFFHREIKITTDEVINEWWFKPDNLNFFYK